MPLPDFLIIGAMKCGTTSLFSDLASHPDIFGPEDKEPHALVDDAVLTADGRQAYERLFAGARADQLCFEASTHYTQLPKFPGVPERARRLLTPDLKLIYLVRDPVERAMSHLHHLLIGGVITEPRLDRALDLFPPLVDYGRYAMQIDPWIKTFGRDRVRIYRFEDYVADRASCTNDAWAWLGLKASPDPVLSEKVYNRSSGRPVVSGIWKTISESRAYRRLLRPLMSRDARDSLKGRLLPKSDARPAPPTHDAVRRVADAVGPDAARLAEIMGRTEPLWDIGRTVERLASRQEMS